MKNAVLELPRAVQIPHNYNNRHLGTLAAAGGKTSSKKIIRTGRTTEYTQEDIDILVNQYNLKTVYDIRTSIELQNESGRTLNDVPGVEYIHFSMFEEGSVIGTKLAQDNEARVQARIKEDPNGLIWFFGALGGTLESVIEFYNETYYTIVTNETCLNCIRKFFDIILEKSSGATMFHCMGGKDRTGSIAAFFLQSIGVGLEDIKTDFLLSNEFFLADTFQEVLDEVLEVTGDPLTVEGVKLICFADLRYLVRARDYILQNFGSVDRFMTEVLYLTDEKRQLLRELYTE